MPKNFGNSLSVIFIQNNVLKILVEFQSDWISTKNGRKGLTEYVALFLSILRS